MKRLRLISSRPAGYRRGGIVIGTAAVPTYLSNPEEMKPEGMLAILRDPNIAIATEEEIDGRIEVLKLEDDERLQVIDALVARIASLAEAEIELQPASGVEGETGGNALPPVNPTTSSEGASNVAAPSNSSPGTETSSAEDYLARWASIWGIDRKGATVTAASVTATGMNGVTIPAGSEAQRVDGSIYTVASAGIIAGGSVVLSIEAAAAGPGTALTAGEQLTLSSAIAGVNAILTVTDGGTGGAAEEQDDALLARLLHRIRTPPQGGALSDYVAWALAQPGVTRAWAYKGWMGAGTVGLGFVMDGRDNIFPLEADVAAVQSALDVLRPVTAELYVFAPTPDPTDIVLRIAPDTPAVRTAIENELGDFFTREGEPGGTIYFSRLSEAVSLAEGEYQHALDIPDSDRTSDAGKIPTLGSVTFA